MINTKLSRYAGWSAFVSAIATILGLVTLLMFFTLGQPWGTINDTTSVILALSIIPVLLALHRLHRRNTPIVSLATFVIGVLATLVAAVFQILLIIRVFVFEQTAIVVPVAFGIFGASLMVYCYLDRANKSLSRTLAWLGMIAGAGYAVIIVGYILGGQDSPLVSIGGLTAVIFYPIWAIWFGRILLSGKLTA